MNRLKEKYQNEVTAKLQEEFGIKNRMAVPRVDMVVVHISLGEAKDDAGILNKVRYICWLWPGSSQLSLMPKNRFPLLRSPRANRSA